MEDKKHPGGRPPIFDSEDDLRAKVNEYFEWVKGERETVINDKGETEERWKRLPEHVTITGLALFLGFESRQSIYDYGEKEGEFSYIIKNARLRVENKYEQNLHSQNCTGSIFALKNMGWKDKTEQDLNVAGQLGVNWHEERTYETKDIDRPEGTDTSYQKKDGI